MNQKIFETWKNIWLKDIPDGSQGEMIFFSILSNAYSYSCIYAEKNKKKNFICKTIFLIAVILIAVIPVVVVIINCVGFSSFSQIQILETDALFIFLFCIIGFVVSKWNDIKKYQETWVRHKKTEKQIEMEMIKFILNIDGYEKVKKKKRRKLFKCEILNILDEDLRLFFDNMDKREIRLYKDFDKIISLRNVG